MKLTCFIIGKNLDQPIRRKDFSYFASRVSEMLQSDECAIVYTDFIDDVGPIMSEQVIMALIQLHTMEKWISDPEMRVLTDGGMEMLVLWWLLVHLEWVSTSPIFAT